MPSGIVTKERNPSNAKLTPRVVALMIEERNNRIEELYGKGFTKTELSVIFNITKQLIDFVLKNRKAHFTKFTEK